jgi:hypothetical protein
MLPFERRIAVVPHRQKNERTCARSLPLLSIMVKPSSEGIRILLQYLQSRSAKLEVVVQSTFTESSGRVGGLLCR